MSFIETCQRWVERLCHAAALFGIACLIGVIGIVVTDIVLRRSLGYTVVGTVDLTQLCVMAAAFWSIPYAFMRNAHVKVDLVTDPLPRRGRALLDGLAALTGFAVLTLLLWMSWDQALLRWQYGDQSQDLGIPMIIYWLFLLSGFVLAAVATLAIALQQFAIAFTGQR